MVIKTLYVDWWRVDGSVSGRLVAIALLIVICAWTGTAEASGLFLQALDAAHAGRTAQAAEMWSKVIQRDRKSYAAHVNRGRAYLDAGYVLRAVADWHTARELAPVFSYGLYSGKYIQEATGDPSVLAFTAPLELDPDHAASVTMAGVMYTEIGEWSKAIELFRKSIDLTRNPLFKSQLEHWIKSLESPDRE